jgi:hypothetical protein
MSLGYPVLSYLNWLVFARLPRSAHEERALITAREHFGGWAIIAGSKSTNKSLLFTLYNTEA